MKKRHTLENGIRIVYENIGRAKSFSMGVWVCAGSVYENNENSGISHFVEHLLFKGTKSQSAIQLIKMLEDVGGYINAMTSREWICIDAYCLDTDYERALYVISDMILHSVFEEKKIEMERMVILDEIKMYNDYSENQIHEKFTDFIWKDCSLGKIPIGTEETVKQITRNDLLSFHENIFVPENIIIAAAGHIPSSFIRDIEKYFDFTKKNFTLTADIHCKPNSGIKCYAKEMELVYFCMGGESYPSNDNAIYAMDVLNTMLGGSRSSRLSNEIREKLGMAYSVYSYNTYFKHTGLFSVYGGVRKENLETCIQIILKEFDNFKKGDFPENEMNQAKERLKGKYILSLESSWYQMTMLAYYERFCNTLFDLKKFLNSIDSVKRDDIINAAEKMFQCDNLAFVSFGPFDDEKFIEELLEVHAER